MARDVRPVEQLWPGDRVQLADGPWWSVVRVFPAGDGQVGIVLRGVGRPTYRPAGTLVHVDTTPDGVGSA